MAHLAPGAAVQSRNAGRGARGPPCVLSTNSPMPSGRSRASSRSAWDIPVPLTGISLVQRFATSSAGDRERQAEAVIAFGGFLEGLRRRRSLRAGPSRPPTTTLPVVIVDERLAREAWPDQSAVGQRLALISNVGGPALGRGHRRGRPRRRRQGLRTPGLPQIWMTYALQVVLGARYRGARHESRGVHRPGQRGGAAARRRAAGARCPAAQRPRGGCFGRHPVRAVRAGLVRGAGASSCRSSASTRSSPTRPHAAPAKSPCDWRSARTPAASSRWS